MNKNIAGIFVCLMFSFICIIVLGVDLLHKERQIVNLKEKLTIETIALEKVTKTLLDQRVQIDRYEVAIADMMQGQWKPGMGLLKTFEEEWYNTPIWVFEAFDKHPGPLIDITIILKQGDSDESKTRSRSDSG